MLKKRAPFLLALALLAALFYRYSGRRLEDFAYYRCGAVAEPAYDPALYAACVEQAAGRPLPELYKRLGYPFSPVLVAAFSLFDRLSFDAAFWAWNALLFAAGAWSLWRSPSPLLLATWPGFILCVAYHKWMLLVFAGLPGAAAGNPQWAAVLGLRDRRSAALSAAALALACLWLWDFGALERWLEALRAHGTVLTRDSQSLSVLFFDGRFALPLGAALLALALWLRSREWYLALMTLALPYTHGSESVWAFPLYEATVKRWGLAVNVALAAAFGFYAPAELSRPVYQAMQGWLTFGVIAIAAGFRARGPGKA